MYTQARLTELPTPHCLPSPALPRHPQFLRKQPSASVEMMPVTNEILGQEM